MPLGITEAAGAVFGKYKPQNVFSIEFARRDKKTGLPTRSKDKPNAEYFFSVGFMNYSEAFKFRVSYDPTFNSGTSIVDMGKGNSQIKLDGEFHIYHTAVPSDKAPDSTGNNFDSLDKTLDTAKNAGLSAYQKTVDKYKGLAGISVRSGVEEFFDLMGLLYYSRFDKDIYSPYADSQGFKLKSILGQDQSFNYGDHCIVFHDYDRNRHIEVMLPNEGFTVSRGTQDTNTYTYSINLIVLSDLEETVKPLAPAAVKSPFLILNSAISDIQNLINYPLKLTGLLLNAATLLKQFTASGQTLVNTFNNMKNQFNIDGKLISSTFQGALNDINRALGRKDKASFTDQVEGLLDEREELLAQITTSEEVFSSQVSNAITQGQSLLYMINTILAPPNITGSIEQESLLPTANTTVLIQNEAYQWTVTFLDNLYTVQSNYIQAGIDDAYQVYYASNSDSFRTIAKDILGDESLGSALASYNKRNYSEYLSGQAIKLPYSGRTGQYVPMPEKPYTPDFEAGIMGFDIALTSRRDFGIAPNGDLAYTQGLTTLIENITDIIDFPNGSWIANELIGNYLTIGETMDELEKQAALSKLLQEIKSDPRVKNAEIISESVDGDILSYAMRITPKAGREFSLRL